MQKPIDIWLTLATVALGIGVNWMPKEPIYLIISLLVMFLLLIHPIWNFWWIEKTKWRRISAIIVYIFCLSLFGYNVWPSHPTTVPPQKQPQQTVDQITEEIESKRREKKALIERDIVLVISVPLNCRDAQTEVQGTYPDIIHSGETFTAPFRKGDNYCLGLAVCNLNELDSLFWPSISIQLKNDVKVKPLSIWRYNQDTMKQSIFGERFYDKLIKGPCRGPDEFIMLVFPKADTYIVKYEITGTVESEFGTISIRVPGTFYMKLLEPK